jgi:hypothetical protein
MVISALQSGNRSCAFIWFQTGSFLPQTRRKKPIDRTGIGYVSASPLDRTRSKLEVQAGNTGMVIGFVALSSGQDKT